MIDEKAFDELGRLMRDDPEVLKRELSNALIRERGAKWLKEHERELEGEWKAIRFQFGF